MYRSMRSAILYGNKTWYQRANKIAIMRIEKNNGVW